MKGNQKFFICKRCGNIADLIENKGIPLVCCGAQMSELIVNTEDASTEKHLPDITISENVMHVAIGSVLHPMEAAHHIMFIYVETEHGGQHKSLEIGNEPKASFCFSNDKAVAVYAYCNLHGLWKTEVN